MPVNTQNNFLAWLQENNKPIIGTETYYLGEYDNYLKETQSSLEGVGSVEVSAELAQNQDWQYFAARGDVLGGVDLASQQVLRLNRRAWDDYARSMATRKSDTTMGDISSLAENDGVEQFDSDRMQRFNSAYYTS